MDWLQMAQQSFIPEQFDSLEWTTKESKILKMIFGHRNNDVEKRLTTEDEWKNWFAEGHIPEIQAFEKGLVVILAGRPDDLGPVYNPVLLSYLPWTRGTFEEIIKRLHINGSTVQTIGTGAITFFNRTHITREKDGIPAIVYNCRSVHSWPGDMALSVTYIPSSRSTYGIMYGCSPGTIVEITGRLRLAEDAVFHPLILPGIFAKIERERHFDLVQNGLTKRVQFVSNLLTNNMYDWKLRSEDEQDTSTNESVDLWMDICHLRNGLKKWKEQLLLMAAHVDELDESLFSDAAANTRTDAVAVPTDQQDPTITFNRKMRQTGVLIKERLTDVILEYDDKIRDCDMVWKWKKHQILGQRSVHLLVGVSE